MAAPKATLDDDPATAAASARETRGCSTTLGSIAWLSVDQLLQVVLALVVGVVIARHLGPARLGDLSFALAVVALLSPIVVSHRQVLVRDLVSEPESRGAIIGTGTALSLLGAIPAIAIGATFALVAGRSVVSTRAILVALSVLVWLALGTTEAVLQAERRAKGLAGSRSGSAIVGAVLKMAFVAGGFGVVGFVIAGSVQALLGALLAIILCGRHVNAATRWSVDSARLRKLFQESWPLAISATSIAIYMTLDQVLLGVLSSEHSVGIYAAAVRISESALLLPVVVITSVTPMLVALYAAGDAGYLRQTQRIINLLTAVSVGVLILGATLAIPAIRIIYGVEYKQSSSVLVVMLIANVFVFQGVASSPWIINAGLQRSYMVRTVVGAGINVGLNLALIPRHGAIGAAIASVVAYGYASIIGTALDPRTRPLARMLVRALSPRTMWSTMRHDLGELRRIRCATTSSDGGLG